MPICQLYYSVIIYSHIIQCQVGTQQEGYDELALDGQYYGQVSYSDTSREPENRIHRS